MNRDASQRLPRTSRVSWGLLLLSAAVAVGSGCRSTGYLAQRRRDLADVATASVGLGLGAKARLGPVHLTPLLWCTDVAGLRGGEWFRSPGLDATVAHPPEEVGALWWSCSVWDLPAGCADRDRLRARGKAHLAAPPYLPPAAELYDILSDTPPFLSIPIQAWPAEGLAVTRYPLSYHSQIELNLALAGSLRLGLNPGEFADFLLGWFRVDIYRDDLWDVPPAQARETPILQPWPWTWSRLWPWAGTE